MVLQKIPFNFGGVMEKLQKIRACQLKKGNVFILIGRRYKVLSIINNVITYSQFTGSVRHHKNTMGAFSSEWVLLETILHNQ